MSQSLEVVVTPDGRMNRKSAAIYTGYAEKTLAKYVSQGKGPRFVKRGRVWYFKHDLDAWIAGETQHTPRPPSPGPLALVTEVATGAPA